MNKKAYTAGHFELQIDGHATTAYLKSVDGGFVKSSVVDEPIGTENNRIKHTATVDIDPFSLDFGLSGANDVLLWIQNSWRKQFNRRNGSVTHGDFNLKSTFEHEFYDALIGETTFPTLDGASKDAAYIKIKVQPERVVSKQVPNGASLRSDLSPKQKLWLCSGFRLNIDGLDEVKYTNKLESFTIKQGIKKMYTGEHRFPQIEPTKIEFPNLVGTIALAHADGLLNWYHKYIVAGQADPKAQKTGSLEFLAPDKATTLFRINLYEVGLLGTSIVSSTANADAIKRLRFELYVGRMDLDGAGTLGMQ